MKKVLINNVAAARLHGLRDMDEYLSAKEEVVNGMGYLSDMLHSARERGGEKIDTFVDELIYVLHILAEYNSLLTTLNKPNDLMPITFSSSRDPFKEDDNKPTWEFSMDCMKAYEISKLLERKGVNLDVYEIQDMTFAECASAAGMSCEGLEAAIANYREEKARHEQV